MSSNGGNFDEAKSNRKITLGAVFGYVYLILQIVSGFLIIPLISGHYGQSQYGIFSLSNSFVSLFMLDIGLSALANRYLASYKAMGKESEIKAILGLIYKIYFALSAITLVIFTAGYFLSDFIFVGLTQSETQKFLQMYLISSIGAVLCFGMQGFDGVLNAYEEYSAVKLTSIFQRSLYLVLCILAITYDWDIVSIAIIASGSNVLSYIIKYLIIRFKTKCKADFKTKLPKELIKELFAFSVWNFIVSICYRLSTFSANPILGIVSDSSNIAIYSVGSEIENYAFMISGVLNGLFIPKISRIFVNYSGEERKDRLTNLAKEVGLIVSSIFMIIFIGFASCGLEFINVWLDNPSYQGAYWVALILMLGQATCTPLVILSNALWFENNIKYMAILRLISLGVFAILAFPLGHFFGAMGVATAVSVGLLVRFVLGLYFSKARLGIRLGQFLSYSLGRQIPGWAIMLGIGLVLHFFLPLSDLYKLIIIVAVLCIVGALTYWFVVFPKNLRSGLLGIFFKKKKSKA